MSALKPGTRLRSQVCATEVVVVRPGDGGVNLTCGGVPMIPFDESASAAPDTAGRRSDLMGGNVLGKRYVQGADGNFEVLVTKQGDGTLADGASPLVTKQAKPLPSSD